MSNSFNRRQFIGAGVGAAATLTGGPLSAQTTQSARWAYPVPGFTVLIAKYLLAKKLDQMTGADLAPPSEYTTVSTYYNDFAVGNFELCIGSWDLFAQRYQAGVPIRVLCTITTADMISIVTGVPSLKNITDLKGKTIAAPQTTGTFRLVSSLIKESYGLELGKDINVQGVDNPASSMTMTMANRADAGLSWEPNVTTALKRRPDFRVIFNAGQAYRELFHDDLPYFAIAVKGDWADRNPDRVRRVRETFDRCINGIIKDPDDAVSIVADTTGFPPAVLAESLRSKRLSFRFGSMAAAEERDSMIKAGEFMKRNGLLTKSIDQGFFVTA